MDAPGRSTSTSWNLDCHHRRPSSLLSTLTRLDSGEYSVCPRSSIHSRAGEALGDRPVAALSGGLGLCSAPSRSTSRPAFAPINSLFLLICRLPLPEPWRGLRDEALDRVSGIPGCVFVHASGFIGGHCTREGALSLARATLAQRPAPTSPTNPLVK